MALADERETKRTSAHDGTHDDCVISAALVTSYFSAANLKNRIESYLQMLSARQASGRSAA